MNPFHSISNHLYKSYLEYDSTKLLAKLEYHVEMTQICEELLVKNRVKIESMGARN